MRYEMRKILSILIIVITLLAVAGLFYRVELQRIQFVLNLFDDDVIVQNFSNMRASAPIVEFPKSENEFKFGRVTESLPSSFNYKNQPMPLDAFLADRLGFEVETKRANVSPKTQLTLSPHVEEILRRKRAEEFELYDSLT